MRSRSPFLMRKKTHRRVRFPLSPTIGRVEAGRVPRFRPARRAGRKNMILCAKWGLMPGGGSGTMCRVQHLASPQVRRSHETWKISRSGRRFRGCALRMPPFAFLDQAFPGPRVKPRGGFPFNGQTGHVRKAPSQHQTIHTTFSSTPSNRRHFTNHSITTGEKP